MLDLRSVPARPGQLFSLITRRRPFTGPSVHVQYSTPGVAASSQPAEYFESSHAMCIICIDIDYRYSMIFKIYMYIMQYNTIQYNTTQHNTTQHNNYNTIQYNIIQYSTISGPAPDTTHEELHKLFAQAAASHAGSRPHGDVDFGVRERLPGHSRPQSCPSPRQIDQFGLYGIRI